MESGPRSGPREQSASATGKAPGGSEQCPPVAEATVERAELDVEAVAPVGADAPGAGAGRHGPRRAK